MGTRSLTVFKDEYNKKEIVVMYRQMDGYPSGHGKELWEAFKDFTIGNGIRLGMDNSKFANGMSCFSAQVIAHFKEEVGMFYLHPAGTRDIGEEYIYTLYVKNGEPLLQVEKVYDGILLYSGTLLGFGEYLEYKNDELVMWKTE